MSNFDACCIGRCNFFSAKSRNSSDNDDELNFNQKKIDAYWAGLGLKRKGTTLKTEKGMALETVGYLVLAIIALIVLWIFLSEMAPAITSVVEDIVKGIACEVCNILGPIGWLVSGVCRGCPTS